jgi:predicted AlkP superfamily phosphohydrolase/phosphomutase
VLDRIDRGAGTAGPRRWVAAVKAGWGRVPLPIRRRLHPLLARTVRHTTSARALQPGRQVPDRAERRFSVMPGAAAVTGIRLNQVGREARGIIPAAERAATLCRLRTELLDLVDLTSGRSAVRRVVDADSVPGGFPDEGYADLFVEWSMLGPARVLYSPTVGIVATTATTARTGDHREGGGLMLARGPGVRAGTRGSGIAPEDIAPTIAALCGVALDGVDGHPIATVLSAAATPSAPAHR